MIRPPYLSVALALLLASVGLAQSSDTAPQPAPTAAPEKPSADSDSRGPDSPLPMITTSWATIDGAERGDGRGDSSTTDRSVGGQVLWGSGSGTWGLGFAVEDRSDANLSPLPGGRAVGGFRSVLLQAFHQRKLARDRKFTGFAAVRGGAEDPGDLTDALGAVLFLGRDRKISDTLRFGWGVVGIYRTGDGLRAFPAPTLEWDPPGPVSASFRGPLSELRVDLSKRWQLALSGRVNLRQYRLSDGTLFYDRQTPVRLGIRRMVNKQVAFEAFVGKLLGREWEVVQRPGLPDATLEVDGGTFYGFQATIPIF